jgi:hypothetical protein
MRDLDGPPLNTRTLAQLERPVRSGDLAALTELGRRLLAGEAGRAQLQRGAELLGSAAGRGDGEALAILATLAGAGVFQPQSWSRALEYLQRSAEAGWAGARAQLTVLAAGRAGASPPPATAPWDELARGIDLEAWTRPPTKRSLSDSPRIRVIERFTTAVVCDWLMTCARGKLRRAQVYAADGGAEMHRARSNSEADFNITESDLVLLLLRQRISAAVGVHTAGMEPSKVLHYAAGESFAPHYDFIDPAAPGYARELALRGQRIGTVLIYLNEGYSGGETEFPQLGLRYKGRCGDALLFANVGDDQLPDRRTLHAGRAPTQGEKWLLSQWIRNRSPADE